MRLEGLDHVAIGVADPEASAAWYCEVLGLERRFGEVWGESPIFVGAGLGALAIFPQRGSATESVTLRGGSEVRHIAFRADRTNFDKARSELVARGIAIEFEDHEISHSIYFQDPDGFYLEITTYEPASQAVDSRQAAGSTAFLRHSIATLAYRGGKVLGNAPDGFAQLRIGPESRTPGEILAHIGDLLDWALSQAGGHQVWHDSETDGWDDEVARFFAALEALDRRLASGEPSRLPEEKMFQGPIADALTHVGQIAMLRRLADAPVRGENYFKAGIEAGRVGADQAEPVKEFD